jgi:hypothetical protein
MGCIYYIGETSLYINYTKTRRIKSMSCIYYTGEMSLCIKMFIKTKYIYLRRGDN